jgi:two-component system, OmpR family, sensor histidine kinase BaeS
VNSLQDGVRSPTAESIASLQAEVATLSKLVGDLYELALADVGALAYRFVRTDILAPLIAIAQRLGRITHHSGRAAPSVVT